MLRVILLSVCMVIVDLAIMIPLLAYAMADQPLWVRCIAGAFVGLVIGILWPRKYLPFTVNSKK